MFSGRFKAAHGIAWINDIVDLTLATCIFSMVLAGYLFIKRRPKISRITVFYVFIYIGFVILAILSYYTGYQDKTATLKIQKFVVFNTCMLFAPILACSTGNRFPRLIRIILALSIIFAFDSIIQFAEGTKIKIGTLGGEGYQGLGRVSGIGLSMIIVLVLFTKVNVNKIYPLLFGAILFCSTMISAARQSFAGFIVVGAFAIYSQNKMKSGVKLTKKYASNYLALFLLFVIVFLFFEHFHHSERYLQRIGTMFSYDLIKQNIRYYIWESALHIWQDNPVLGVGFGAFSQFSGLLYYDHPHNLFLEILCEMGISGFLLLINLIGVPLKIGIYASRRVDIDCLILTTAFLFILSCTMFSGDIASNRILFAFSGWLLAYKNVLMRISKSETYQANKR